MVPHPLIFYVFRFRLNEKSPKDISGISTEILLGFIAVSQKMFTTSCFSFALRHPLIAGVVPILIFFLQPTVFKTIYNFTQKNKAAPTKPFTEYIRFCMHRKCAPVLHKCMTSKQPEYLTFFIRLEPDSPSCGEGRIERPAKNETGYGEEKRCLPARKRSSLTEQLVDQFGHIA